jgi:hypothetical protein
MAPYQLQQHDVRVHTRAHTRHTRKRYASDRAQTTPCGAGDGRAGCTTRTREHASTRARVKEMRV